MNSYRDTGSGYRRLMAALTVLALLTLLLTGQAGCRSETEASESSDRAATVIVDDAGRQVTLRGRPARVAAGASFALELLMAMNHPPILRPDVQDSKVYPAEALSITKLAVQHGSGPDLEMLAASRADLIILHTNFAAFAPGIERALGVPVLLLEIRGLEDVGRKMGLLGQILGDEAGAKEAQGNFEAACAAVLRGLPDRGPRVLALFGTPDAYYAFRDSSYVGSMLKAVNAENIGDSSKTVAGASSVAPVDLEQVVLRDPEYVFVVPHGGTPAVLEQLAAHPAWGRIRAVREKRVYVLDEALFSSNPGPRGAVALAQLKSIMYGGNEGGGRD